MAHSHQKITFSLHLHHHINIQHPVCTAQIHTHADRS